MSGISGNQSLEIRILNAQFDKEYELVKDNKVKREVLERDYAKKRADIEYYYSKLILEQQIKFAEAAIAVERATNGNTALVIAKEKQLADLKN